MIKFKFTKQKFTINRIINFFSGVICAGAATIPEDIFLVSAERLANLVTEEDLDVGSLYPPLNTIRDCSIKIAVEVMKYAYEKGLYRSQYDLYGEAAKILTSF